MDTLGRCDPFQTGKNFIQVIHQGSFSKGLNFLMEIQKKGIVLNWEFYTQIGKKLERLHFCGRTEGDNLFLIGAKNSSDLLPLFNKIFPEQKKNLEKALHDGDNSASEQDFPASSFQNDEIYDQLTALYNELANMQRQLVKKNVELERLSKQKNHFLGMAAHELRHPLGIIHMLTGFLQEECAYKLEPEQMEYLNTIDTLSESMQKLIDDFLSISTIESGKLSLKKEPARLVEIFQNNLSLNKLNADRKHIELVFCHDEKIPVVMVDPSKMEQVLNNLIANALKFSPEGSRIEVCLRQTGDEIILSVKDQGTGISPELLPRLFDPFEKSHSLPEKSYQGSGLGLAIAKKIVESHGGEIHAESETGKGSTFVVKLPVETRSS